MYGKGYLKKTLYGAGYLKTTLYNAVSSLLVFLKNHCGLLSYSDKVDSGIMYDKTGQTRDAVLAKSLDGDGSMYVEFGSGIEVPNGTFEFLINLNALNAYQRIRVTNGIEYVTIALTSVSKIGISNTDGLVGLGAEADFSLSTGVDYNVKIEYTGVISETIFTINNSIVPTSLRNLNFTKSSADTLLARNSGISAINASLKEYKETINGKTYTLDIPGLSSDTIQLVNLDDSSDFIQGTLMLPSATPTSFTDKVVSIEDMYGYTIADGSQYRDSALTQQYLVGAIIPCDKRGISFSFVSDGQGGSLQPRADFVGEVGIDFRIVDGVVDNGVDYENWEALDGASTSELGFTGTFISQRPIWVIRNSELKQNTGLKPNTQYTCVVNATVNTCDQYLRNGGSTNFLFGTTIKQILPANTTGEFRTLFDSVNFNIETFEQNFVHNANTTGQLQATITFYEGDYVTGNLPLPTSQALVVGNSVILNDTYGDITTTDNNEVLWDKTNLVNKVVPVENVNYHNQFFINADETRISFYDSELTEPCLTKALSLMKL